MFKFHGWVVTHTGARLRGVREDFEKYDKEQRDLFEALKGQVRQLEEHMQNCFFFNDGLNGMYSMMATGLFNHRREVVLDVFRWLAENGHGSYGLVYVWDDEDPRGTEFYEYRVWRLAKGQFEEFDDLILSPGYPIRHDPSDPFTWEKKAVPGNCQTCNGSGTCIACRGRGERSIVCTACRGNRACSTCGGRGMVDLVP